MDKSIPVAQPFLDWFGVWAGQAGRDENLHAWLEDPPLGVRLRVQPARRSAVIFRGEKPWEALNLNHMTVLLDEGRYRMWYMSAPRDDENTSFVCYAESADGYDWQRPALGVVEFQGSKANNIVSDRQDFGLESVFSDPVAPPEERYKAIDSHVRYHLAGAPVPATYANKLEIRRVRREMEQEGRTVAEIDAEAGFRRGVRGAVSADGLRWKVLEELLLDVGDTPLDTQNIAAYDEDAGEYVAYLRGHLERRRCVRRTGGESFGNWHPTRLVLMPDTFDQPDEDLYTSAYCRSPGSGRRLMFPGVFHRLAKAIDIQLASSHDGWNWTRPERKPIITRETEGEPYGAIYASPNLVPLGEDWALPYKGIYGGRGGDEERASKTGSQGEYRWALWRPDRLVALEAPNEGQFTTVERICQGKDLRLNFQTEPGGWIKAAMAHKPTTPPTPVEELAGFGMEECDPLEGDQVSQVVSWKGRTDLAALEGRHASVRVRMMRAKLFSIAL